MFIFENYYFANSDELIVFHKKINSTVESHFIIDVKPIGLMLNKIYNPFHLVYQYRWVEIKNNLHKVIDNSWGKYYILSILNNIVLHNESSIGKYINKISYVTNSKIILPQMKTYDLDMERVDKLLAHCSSNLNKQMLIYLTNLLLQIENSPRMLRKILDLSQGKIDEYLLYGPITISDDKKSIEDLHMVIDVIHNVQNCTPHAQLLYPTLIRNMNACGRYMCILRCDNIDLIYKVFRIDSNKYQIYIWFNYPFIIATAGCTLTAIKPQNGGRDQIFIYEYGYKGFCSSVFEAVW